MFPQNQQTINIQPTNHTMKVELDSTTTVLEIFEYIHSYLQQQKIKKDDLEEDLKKWTCYSVSRKKYLKIEEQIGNYQNETFNINIQPDFDSSNQKVEDITLQIDIKDSINIRKFEAIFKSNQTLQNVAEATLSYCQLSQHQNIATVDLFIFDQPYNDDIKRLKSLQKLQLKNNTTIEARIRWIGG